jgi:hypothetical protein
MRKLLITICLILSPLAKAEPRVFVPVKAPVQNNKRITLAPLMNSASIQTIVGASRDVIVIFDGTDSVRLIESFGEREISQKVRPEVIQDNRDGYGCLTLKLTSEFLLSECIDQGSLFWILQVGSESIPMQLATPAFSIQIK